VTGTSTTPEVPVEIVQVPLPRPLTLQEWYTLCEWLGYGDEPLAWACSCVGAGKSRIEKAENAQEAAESRVRELEIRMRDAGTPYSIEQDKINALVPRVAALKSALWEIVRETGFQASTPSLGLVGIRAIAVAVLAGGE
jgi:hypothetical protein